MTTDPYTQIAVATSKEYPATNTFMEDKSTFIQNTWNDYIRDGDSTGDPYNMYTHLIDSKIKIPDRTDVFQARDSAQTWIEQNMSSLADKYDGVYIYDDYGYDTLPADGAAYIGKMDNRAASSSDRFVAIEGANNSTGLGPHEVTHLYNGLHKHHETWGWAEYTIMGNPGDTQCDGETTSDDRFRRGDYHHCVVDMVRKYIDYWHDKGHFYPQ